jgi:hypothetical protein
MPLRVRLSAAPGKPKPLTACGQFSNCTFYAANDLAGPLTKEALLASCYHPNDMRGVNWAKFGNDHCVAQIGGTVGNIDRDNWMAWFTPGTQRHNEMIGGILSVRGTPGSKHAVAFHKHTEGFLLYDSFRAAPLLVTMEQTQRGSDSLDFLAGAQLLLVMHSGDPHVPIRATHATAIDVTEDSFSYMAHKDTRSWLQQAAWLHHHDEALSAREAANTRWLMEVMGAHVLVSSEPSLAKAWSYRHPTSGKETIPEPQQKRAPQRVLSGPLVSQWLETPSQEAKNTIVAKAFRDFLKEQPSFGLTNLGRVKVVDEENVLVATHLVFMVTDWLITPRRWASCTYVHVHDRAAVLAFCINCLAQLNTTKLQQKNVELFMELAGVVGVLGIMEEAMWDKLWSDAVALATLETTKWDDILVYEGKLGKSRRFYGDIELHILLLRAWTCSVACSVHAFDRWPAGLRVRGIYIMFI